MKNKLLFLLVCSLISFGALAQNASTADSCNFETPCTLVVMDSASGIWQIGPPQKAIFDSAYSLPNALVTDTLNTYPVNQECYFDVDIIRC